MEKSIIIVFVLMAVVIACQYQDNKSQEKRIERTEKYYRDILYHKIKGVNHE